MKYILYALLICSSNIYAEVLNNIHVWKLNSASIVFSISVFNNTETPVQIPKRWGSSRAKWIAGKKFSIRHGDGKSVTDSDLFYLPAGQAHIYTFCCRIPAEVSPTHLEFSVETYGIGDCEFVTPPAISNLTASINLFPDSRAIE